MCTLWTGFLCISYFAVSSSGGGGDLNSMILNAILVLVLQGVLIIFRQKKGPVLPHAEMSLKYRTHWVIAIATLKEMGDMVFYGTIHIEQSQTQSLSVYKPLTSAQRDAHFHLFDTRIQNV